MLNYGEAAPAEDFIIGALIPLGLPVGPERDESTGLPCYVVTVLPGHDNRYVDNAVVSVHTLGTTRAEADQWARKAHKLLISLTPGDNITGADGTVFPGAWVCPMGQPSFADYRDPHIKRYNARYKPELRYTATQPPAGQLSTRGGK